jgi:hypothetical protein
MWKKIKQDEDEPKIVEKDECDDCEGKCRADETETCEKCAVELRIGCGNNPSDESIFNGLCDDCRDEEDVEEEVDIVFNCESCKKPIVRDSFEHDHSKFHEDDEDKWYCVDCPLPDEDEDEESDEDEPKIVEKDDEESDEDEPKIVEKDEPKIVEKEKKITDLPEDMTKLIASYVKPKSYAEMSTDELDWMESEIQEALRDKRKIYEDDSSDKFMVIGAEYFGPETFFKVDKAKYSKDLADYVVKGGDLYHKGEPVEVPKVESEGGWYRPKEIYWASYPPDFDDEE